MYFIKLEENEAKEKNYKLENEIEIKVDNIKVIEDSKDGKNQKLNDLEEEMMKITKLMIYYLTLIIIEIG